LILGFYKFIYLLTYLLTYLLAVWSFCITICMR